MKKQHSIYSAVKVRKVGDSIVISLPKHIREAVLIHEGDFLRLSAVPGKSVVAVPIPERTGLDNQTSLWYTRPITQEVEQHGNSHM